MLNAVQAERGGRADADRRKRMFTMVQAFGKTNVKAPSTAEAPGRNGYYNSSTLRCQPVAYFSLRYINK